MFIVDMKVIFRWVQNRHHEPVFISVHVGLKLQDTMQFSCNFLHQPLQRLVPVNGCMKSCIIHCGYYMMRRSLFIRSNFTCNSLHQPIGNFYPLSTAFNWFPANGFCNLFHEKLRQSFMNIVEKYIQIVIYIFMYIYIYISKYDKIYTNEIR